ncbi:MAG: hypothetical protein K1X74_07950 [Pirellulales bacterium]|nr:hypothetical protein [Pirellulales bacterium]
MLRLLLGGVGAAVFAFGLSAVRLPADEPPPSGGLASQPAPDQPPADAPHPPGKVAERYVGRVITVPSPITDRVEQQVRRAAGRTIEDAKRSGGRTWPVLIFEFTAGTSDLGKAYDLADYISSGALAGATTVAYVPQDLSGHAVLPVLACDQIVLQPEARLGAAGIDEKTIGPGELNLYKSIAERRKTVPVALALGLLDTRLEVLEVETEVGREFILSSDLEALRANKAIQSETPIFRAGEQHWLDAATARRLGVASRLAASTVELAKAFGLPRSALQPDPSLEGGWRAMRVAIEGPVHAALVNEVERTIAEALEARKVNLVFLNIDSPGGSPKDSLALANFLADLDANTCRTVAYVDREARGDAAMIVLACDEIVLRSTAELGGEGAYAFSGQEEIDDTRKAVSHLLTRKFRSPALGAALVAPSPAVYRYTQQQTRYIDYFDAEQAESLPDADQWQRGEAVSVAGEVLKLDAQRAAGLGLANHTVARFDELKRLYGLEDDPELVEPGWAHFLIGALKSPAVAYLLLVIGGAALWAELHTPGLGVGGFIALVCVLLFFWSRFLGGTAGWLEAVLFVAGVVCVLCELFVFPGFGIFGLGGIALVLASLILASQTFVWPRNDYQLVQTSQSLLVVAAAAASIVVLAVSLRRVLPHAPVLNDMVLAPPVGEAADDLAAREALAHYEHLLGRRGVTTTQLTPGGKARFEGRAIDVLSGGEFIAAGATVEVLSVHGNRVQVRQVG